MTQRRNKPQTTEALVERVRETLDALGKRWGPLNEARYVTAARDALTELTERLAAAERQIIENHNHAASLIEAAERERDEARTSLEWRTSEFHSAVAHRRRIEAHVKVLEEVLRTVRFALAARDTEDVLFKTIDAALSQVREPCRLTLAEQ